MSSYGFIKELIEKEHTPTPAYVFDLNKMKEFVKKVQSCLGESAQGEKNRIPRVSGHHTVERSCCKTCRYTDSRDNPSAPQSLLLFFFCNTPFYLLNPFLIFQHL